MQSQRRQSRVHRFLGLLFLGSLTLSLWLGHVPFTVGQAKLATKVIAQTTDASQQVQRGVDLYEAENYNGAIEAWQTALGFYQHTNNRASEAIVLENLARAYQEISENEKAIAYWERAITSYQQTGDIQQVGRLLTEQAQAYTNLGQPLQAIALLCDVSTHEQSCTPESALQIARRYGDHPGEAAALGSLGEAYRVRGEYNRAIDYLNSSLTIAIEIDHLTYRASALNSLGTAYINLANVDYRRVHSAEARGDTLEAENLKKEALTNDSKALTYFQDSFELAHLQNNQLGQLQSLLNSLPPYYRTQPLTATIQTWQQAFSLLQRLPDSRTKAYATIRLANLLQPTTLFNEISSKRQCLKPELQTQAEELFKQAIAIAKRIEDRRSESFALGELGHIYECRKNYQQALDLTQQARLAADQNLLAKDSLYLWEWQAGRIFNTQGQKVEAIKAYERAIATLKTIRDNILITNRDLQFDFRDTVEPIYRELVELRLNQAELTATPADEREKNIRAALNTIDALKLAELQNYFGNDCFLRAVNEGSPDLVDEGTAVFNSIILQNRTGLILSLPSGEQKLAWINIDRENFRQEINAYRIGLERFFDDYEPEQAQKIYNWLIRPFASDLEQAQIKTLVFIHDGLLRSVPMAALHDGETFLIQKYAIAKTPSLTVTTIKAPQRKDLRVLALGLTKSATIEGRYFPALTYVRSEIDEIETQLPDSNQLLDNEFTRSRLQEELSQTIYPIIHIATHGEFGTESSDSFLVTGNNEKLTINELDTLIRRVTQETNSVDLLALTACQTAVGDDRAALGLAGIAVQAGARSALASLWFINDAATAEIATQFYANLRDSSMTKAEALRMAQQSLIETGGQFAHPAYWAAFVLIGNWL